MEITGKVGSFIKSNGVILGFCKISKELIKTCWGGRTKEGELNKTSRGAQCSCKGKDEIEGCTLK